MRRALAVLLIVLAPVHAQAQEDDRLRWSPGWARVHPASYAVVGAVGGFSIMFDNLYDGGPEAQLRGPTVIDAPVRDALMASSDDARELASRISDILLGVLIVWPMFDAGVIAGIADTNTDVFWQLASISLESYAAELLISTLFKELVARERPHGVRCTLEDRLESPERCGPSGRLRSFYSGHASFSFSAAGQVCVTHTHLPLYGSDAADAFACGAAMVVATSVAVLRMIADRHYVTDVLVGTVIGLGTGFLLPYLLHFQWDPRDELPPDVAAPARAPLSAPLTLGWGGRF